MKKTVAVVPINALDQAKSRLAGVLTPEQRRRLVFWMAGCVLRTVALSGVAERILVVSPDADALDWAAARGATPIRQHGGRLNAGLFQARRAALRAGAEALLVLLGDLPLLTAEELRTFVAWAPAGGAVALAPDRRHVGTNGMLLCPADAIPFAFGRASFGRHVELADTAGIPPRIFTSPGLAFDVDEPEDIVALRLHGLWTPDGILDDAPYDDLTPLSLKEGA